uniref:NADH-ubiquinone oxidoreductase chain 6 n=1 Tax=Axianassa australis TaxID=576642 RepID=A0A4Y5QJK3_9EUCA|nr:NADH dehydrogenase subunit 6 [Axianassa australis]QCX31749.1 NADH dehydrogenase subunit 6 [Axianassa australis]
MFLMTIPIMILLSFTFTRLIHPLSMGLALLTQTSLVCLTIGMITPSPWFSYILFLIFLGGMMVLFIYVASLASNEHFKLSPLTATATIMSLLLTIPVLLWDTLFAPTGSTSFSPDPTLIMPDSYSILTKSIYQTSTTPLTLFIIIYLLITLFAVVKITDSYFGPLRLSN